MQSSTKRVALSPTDGKPIEIETKDGKLVAVDPAPDSKPTHWIAPGMIDIQVNGFAGVDYNSPDTPLEEIARSVDVQRASGVTRLLPTVITGSNENIRGSLANLAQARRELPQGKSFPGFHVEGPWISPVDGPRGAHPVEHVRPPSVDEFEQFQDAAEGAIRIVTLGPEHPGSTAVIEHMVAKGVTVSIGHTDANYEQVRDAISAGATMSTHLGNGAHSTIPRHENYIFYQMAADELVAGLIVDGIHLPPCFVKVAVRAKGLERSILVTDAAPPAGCEPGHFHFGHIEVDLTPDNRVQLANGRLAGSALSMDRGLENMIRFTGLSLFEALLTATVNPARSIGLDERRGFLEPGDPADFFFFEYDEESGAVKVEGSLLE